VAQVTVNGGNGGNTFNDTPSVTTTYFINGGTAGDTLNTSLAGTTNPMLTETQSPVTGFFSGQYTFGNRMPVNFTNMKLVSPGNPTFTVPGTVTNNEGDPVNLNLMAQNVDPGSISATNLPPGLNIDPGSGTISGTIDPRGTGTYAVSVTATGQGLKGGTSFTWVVNDTPPPALTNPGNQTATAGQTVNLPIASADPDPGSFRATNLPPGLNIDPGSGTISGTIKPGTAGSFSVTVSASDGGVIGSTSFTFVVNPLEPGVFAVGAGPGGLPRVDVYDAASGAFKYQFQAFETGFTGGVRVAVARDASGSALERVRNPAALADLPEPERHAWQAFWQDVAGLLQGPGPTQ
jgi:hypothetical protein